MSKLIATVLCLAGLASGAADLTAAYTASERPATLADGALAFVYDGDDRVVKLTADVPAGDTLYLTGDALAFGAGAAVETAGLGDLVISNAISGTSGLLVTNTSANTGWLDYAGDLLPSNAWATVFTGVDLDDLEIVSADNSQNRAGGLANPQKMAPYWTDRRTVDGVKTMSFQLQVFQGGYTKGVKVDLRQNGANVEGRVPAAWYRQENILGEDLESLRARWAADGDAAVNKAISVQHIQAPDTGVAHGYGVEQLTARRRDVPGVSLVNAATGPALGGAIKVAANARLTRLGGVSPFAAAVTLDIDGLFETGDRFNASAAVLKGNGTFAVVASKPGRADPYESCVARFVPTNGVSSKATENGIGLDMVNTTTGYNGLNLGHSLFDLTDIRGFMWGSGMPWKNTSANPATGYNVATPCHWRVVTNGVNSYATVQMQSSNTVGMIRCTYLKFWQDTYSLRVAAVTNKYCYTPRQAAPNTGAGYFGMDFDDLDANPGIIGNNALNATYMGGVKIPNSFSVSNLVCRFSRPAEYLFTVNASNQMQNARLVVEGRADGARVIAGCNGLERLPLNGEVEVRSGGTLSVSAGRAAPDTASQNATAWIRVYSNGVLRTYGAVQNTAQKRWAFLRSQRIDLLGGEFLPAWMCTYVEACCYLNNLTLSDGARVTCDLPVRAGCPGTGEPSRWRVRGTAPSFLDAPVQFVSLKGNGYHEFTIDVADVTGDAATDFYVTKSLSRDTLDNGYANADIGKYGPGTLEASGAIGLSATNCVNIYGGVWKLGASGITDAAAQRFHLSGGTLAAADGTANAAGMLSVAARGGRLALGEGAVLTFADSHAADWAGALTVEGFAEEAVRFGTSRDGLSAAQRKRLVTSGGATLHLNSAGWLTAFPDGFMMLVR